MDRVIAEYDIGNFDYNTIRPLKTNITEVDTTIIIADKIVDETHSKILRKVDKHNQ